MKKIRFIILIISIAVGSQFINAQQAWFSQTSGTTQQLNSVCFSSLTNGWAVGNGGTILSTTNAGLIWNQQNSGTTSDLKSVSFISQTTTGWAVGINGVILFTSSGGSTWSVQQNNNPNLTLYSICNSGGRIYSTGFELNLGPAIDWTTNAGQSWLKVNYDMQPINTFNSVNFPSSANGWIVTGGGRIFHAINGLALNEQVSGVSSPLYSVFFTDNFTGYITGANGVILKTPNGATWTQQQSNVNANLFSVHFPDPSTGYTVGGNGTVLKTINGGTAWTSQNSGVSVNLRSVYFANTLTGWAVGDSGKIINTQTGGITGMSSQRNITPSGFVLNQNYPNPFNPVTMISYQLPANSIVKLTVYDILGNKVSEPVNEMQNAGTHNISFDGSKLSSGMYFYKLETNGFTDTKKMLMIK